MHLIGYLNIETQIGIFGNIHMNYNCFSCKKTKGNCFSSTTMYNYNIAIQNCIAHFVFTCVLYPKQNLYS